MTGAEFAPAGRSGVGEGQPPPFQAEIVCDATTGTISTRAFGYGFQPNSPVTAKFTVLNGSYVTPATAGVIPQRNQSVTVPATVGPDGVIAATGYTRAGDPAPYLFYAETVEVWILHRDTGEPISSRTATCSRDLRTTLTTIPAADREALQP